MLLHRSMLYSSTSTHREPSVVLAISRSQLFLQLLICDANLEVYKSRFSKKKSRGPLWTTLDFTRHTKPGHSASVGIGFRWAQ